MIESFSFGQLVVAGKTYANDIIIYPDGRIQDSWWRKSGHRMDLDDIADLIALNPEVIVVGTGVYGYMKPDDDVKRALAQNNIRLVAAPTGEAWQAYNELVEKTSTGGCFHVGC